MSEFPRMLSSRYRLIEQIGDGGASPVWRAYDEVLRRRVAVKILTGGPRREPRLRAGVQAAAFLNHPNINAVYDYGVTDGEPYVVMELLDGISLAARLAQGPLPWRAAAEVCAYVAAALSAAHARRLAHRAVAPGTVVLTETGVKVLGFGLAGAGSPDDPAADVYDLGLLFFTAVTGRTPPRRASVLPFIAGMPFEAVAIYEQCVAAEPSARPLAATVARRLAALAGVRVGAVDLGEYGSDDTTVQYALETPTLTGTRELPSAPPGPRRSRRRAVMVLAAAAIAAVAGATAAAAALGPALSSPSATARWSAAPGPGALPGTSPATEGTTAPEPAAQTCRVAYRVTNTWDNGANVSLSITDTGPADVPNWAVSFDLGPGQQSHGAWNGTWQQQGTRVTVTGLPGHADLPAGQSVNDVGASIDGLNAADVPTRFTLNGAVCEVAPQP